MIQEKHLTPEQRRRRYRQEMVDNILSIAREMMRADGVASLNLNAIARRLGMTPPALYTYFEGKQAIYDALFKLGSEEFGRRLEPAILERESPCEQLKAIFEAHMSFALDNPDLYQLMVQRQVSGFVPSAESLAVCRDHLGGTGKLLRQFIDGADFGPAMPIDEACDLLFAMARGMTDLHLANDPGLPAGQGRFGKLPTRAAQLFIKAMEPLP